MFSVKRPLTKRNILKQINEWDIFKTYCDSLEYPNTSFCSSLRKDISPSCRVSNLNGNLLYKDFGGDKKTLNCFQYVEERYGLSFMETLLKINRDFGLGLEDFGKKLNSPPVEGKKDFYKMIIPKNSKTIIKIKKRVWQNFDKVFWYNNYHIDKPLLEESYTFPISHFWVNNLKTGYKDKIFTIGPKEPAYAYYFYLYKSIYLWKIYRPNKRDESQGKWVSNVNNTVVDGIKEIDKEGDLLLITSSRKDRLLLKSMGYNTVSSTSESYLAPEVNIKKFKERFKRVIIYYDNDLPGLTYAKKFAKQYALEYIHNPLGEPKDVSDFQKEYKNINKTIHLVKQLVYG